MGDTVVLCIPGDWESREAFVRAVLASSQGKCIAAGVAMMHPGEKTGCEWMWQGPDASMAGAFRYAMMGAPEAEAVLDRIATHRSVVYLISTDRGEAVVRAMWAFAEDCLKAGGMGVKVEGAGRAWSPSAWRPAPDRPPHLEELYRLFVFHHVALDDGFLSRGMQQFGFPNTLVKSASTDEAATVAMAFERYQLFEAPDMREGQTFSSDAESARWRIGLIPHPWSAQNEALDLSLGVWTLEPAGAPVAG